MDASPFFTSMLAYCQRLSEGEVFIMAFGGYPTAPIPVVEVIQSKVA